MLKYKKRLKQMNLKEGQGDFTAFRSHGAPCSCFVCRDEKYSRKMKHKDAIIGRDFEGV